MFPSVLLSVNLSISSLYSSFSRSPQPSPKEEGKGSRIHRRKAIYAIELFLKLGKEFKWQYYWSSVGSCLA